MCVLSRRRLLDSDLALNAPQFLVEDMEIVPQLLLWEDFIETFLQACRSKDQINHRESLFLSLSLSLSHTHTHTHTHTFSSPAEGEMKGVGLCFCGFFLWSERGSRCLPD